MRAVIFCLILFIPVILYAAEDSRLDAVNRIESFLDEREAVSFYIDPKLDGINCDENASSAGRIDPFEEALLNDPDMTRDARLAITKRLMPSLISSAKYDDVLRLCDDFSKRYPESKMDILRLYYSAGESFQNLKRYDQAIESYEKALHYSEKSGLAGYIRINLGWCYCARTRYSDAIEEYASALKEGTFTPETVQWVWLEKGRCYFFLGDRASALDSFKEVLKTGSDTKLAKQAKANIEDIEKTD